MRLDLAAFRELEAFAQLGTDLDAATQKSLDRGYRLNELLKQGLCKPMHVTDQVLSIYAATRGFLDKVPVSRVGEYEVKMLAYVHAQEQAAWDKITEVGKLTPEVETEMKRVLGAFTAEFLA